MFKEFAGRASGMDRRRKMVVVGTILGVSATTLGAAYGGTQMATQLSLGDGKVVACVNTSTGAIRIIEPRQSCAINGTPANRGLREVKVSWNAKGPRGATGATGAAGDDGSNGAVGAPGPTGATGDKGSAGTTGAVGATGAKGETGAKGAQGDQGDAGSNGTNGTNGTDGAKGDKGDQGDAGANGTDGAQGAKGDKGDKGDAGTDGAKGDTGAAGAQGAKGDKGDAGAMGTDGAPGAEGPAGPAGPAGPSGAGGGVTLKDGNGNAVGSVVTMSTRSVTVVTSKGYVLTLNWDGSIANSQVYYSNANCSGTAWLNDGTGSNGSAGVLMVGKAALFSGSLGTLMVPASVSNGYATSVNFDAAGFDNPACGTVAAPVKRGGWLLQAATKADIGLPASNAAANKVSVPLTF